MDLETVQEGDKKVPKNNPLSLRPQNNRILDADSTPESGHAPERAVDITDGAYERYRISIFSSGPTQALSIR